MVMCLGLSSEQPPIASAKRHAVGQLRRLLRRRKCTLREGPPKRRAVAALRDKEAPAC